MEKETKKSPIKLILSSIFILITISILVIYWIIPSEIISFSPGPEDYNFNLNASLTEMQFSYNMRYPNKEISYKIENCILQKKQDMEYAFEILEELTILEFYPVYSDQEISITCEEKNRFKDNLFIAGEGGPTNITLTDNFNVILNGKILLIKPSQCSKPNIAIHELLHALGFAHYENPKNIMYPQSKCSQEIGDDILNKINQVYSTQSYADLNIEDVSASLNKNYLDINISLRNEGLKKSEKSNLKIYLENNLIKEIKISKLQIGHGTQIILSNLPVQKSNSEELKIQISYNYNELNKSNNEFILKIKNKELI